jgi:hypothetical protein
MRACALVGGRLFGVCRRAAAARAASTKKPTKPIIPNQRFSDLFETNFVGKVSTCRFGFHSFIATQACHVTDCLLMPSRQPAPSDR